jgi:diguanylate cyclase (GGDEF)-like protein/PAS domain S-box-containing protein
MTTQSSQHSTMTTSAINRPLEGQVSRQGQGGSGSRPVAGYPAGRVRSSRAARWWVGFGVWQAALGGAYFARPQDGLWLWPPIGLSAVVATLAGVRLLRPARPLGWYLLAASELCFVAGDTSYRVLTKALGQINPFPSIADVCYLPTYPLFAAGLFVLIRGRAVERDTSALLDALIITTGLALLSWVDLVEPYFRASGLTMLQRLVSIGYPLGDVLVLAMLAQLLVAGGLRLAATRLLVLGAVGLIVSDVCYGWIQLHSTWRTGTPIDLGWALYYTGWGAAALHPTMRQVDQVARRPSERLSRPRVAALAAASLIPPGVLISQALTGRVRDGVTIGVFAATLFGLVISRLARIVASHRQSLARERVLRACGDALVTAHGLPEVYRAVLDGVAALRGRAGDGTEASLFMADSGPAVSVSSNRIEAGTPAVEAYWWLAQNGGDLDAAGQVSVTPLRRELELCGMLVVRSTQPISWDEHGALTTLASQAALAIESVTLAADLRQRQSEAHFRGLIQNASDVIMVVDPAGTIGYAAPSLERALGRRVESVLGRSLFELVHEADVAEARNALDCVTLRTGEGGAADDWRLRHADGSYLAFEVLFNNLLEDPTVAGIVLTMRDVSGRRALEQQLTHQAFHDSLTNLANRVLFRDRAEHALARASRLGTLVAIVLLDIDSFKDINDTRGHAAGDELLITVARRFRSILRAGATLARLGGDEFAILVEDIIDEAEAEQFAQRLLAPFAAPFVIHGEKLLTTASAGLVLTTDAETELDLSGLLRCADLALYSAKERGKGQLVRYDPGLHARMLDRLALRSELQRAVEANEFYLHYQPIVAIDTGLITGAEALVRWSHPTRGTVPPQEFIGLAEDTGLVVQLGRWVLEQACGQARTWREQGYVGISVSVNVSGRQLQEAGFLDEVQSVLNRHDIPPGVLVLELTESVLVHDGRTVPERLAALKQLGVRVAIDDFGTGYSSLAYLSRFPINMLKVDKSFIDGLGTGHPDDGALAHAIVSLAHTLRLEVVAEGIERAAQRDELWSLGCALGQGYLYSPPVTADELSDLLASSGHLGPPPVGALDANITRRREPPITARAHTAPAPGCPHPPAPTP